jgi:hypothetical protein
MMSWKRYGMKHSWLNLRYCKGISLETGKLHKTTVEYPMFKVLLSYYDKASIIYGTGAAICTVVKVARCNGK